MGGRRLRPRVVERDPFSNIREIWGTAVLDRLTNDEERQILGLVLKKGRGRRIALTPEQVDQKLHLPAGTAARILGDVCARTRIDVALFSLPPSRRRLLWLRGIWGICELCTVGPEVLLDLGVLTAKQAREFTKRCDYLRSRGDC